MGLLTTFFFSKSTYEIESDFLRLLKSKQRKHKELLIIALLEHILL